MLVLTRKPQEKIVIDGRIEVTVLETRNGRVKLGIRCPDDVVVCRTELLDRMRAPAREERATAVALV